MWIRTQDKKKLMQITSFSITRNYGGKLKFAVVGSIAGASAFSNLKIVGLYKTEDETLQELDVIQKYLETGNTGVYQVN
jgi:hypothetical protein|nr:hypothetical protein [uncultured bacterium]|tara:strand:+ start:133 stop:369 length:237 start_codon:yes stop_codon:yes gene_type:complete